MQVSTGCRGGRMASFLLVLFASFVCICDADDSNTIEQQNGGRDSHTNMDYYGFGSCKILSAGNNLEEADLKDTNAKANEAAEDYLSRLCTVSLKALSLVSNGVNFVMENIHRATADNTNTHGTTFYDQTNSSADGSNPLGLESRLVDAMLMLPQDVVEGQSDDNICHIRFKFPKTVLVDSTTVKLVNSSKLLVVSYSYEQSDRHSFLSSTTTQSVRVPDICDTKSGSGVALVNAERDALIVKFKKLGADVEWNKDDTETEREVTVQGEVSAENAETTEGHTQAVVSEIHEVQNLRKRRDM
eukprot:GHVQ01013060.1.p1 GENE.GHVQ01013060.1~~GHVQ01013060.1.p1  ORF type:complete len:301 (+),score=54.86 GHVQ01013060.1:340-1242(+)